MIRNAVNFDHLQIIMPYIHTNGNGFSERHRIAESLLEFVAEGFLLRIVGHNGVCVVFVAYQIKQPLS
jgi:hypothetical protein